MEHIRIVTGNTSDLAVEASHREMSVEEAEVVTEKSVTNTFSVGE